jgi:DNA invertase Pin-like site-specific DNA recombinase
MSVALVYGRASADPSDQRISVDRQVKLGTARALDLWPDAEVRVFRDDAITAADPNVHRPGYAAFLAAVRAARKGEIAGVVVNEQSRLTRQGTGAWDELVVTLTKAGVTKVETLRAGPVSVEPGSRLVGRILAVVDAEEVERTKARVQDAHRDLFTEGRPSGRAPFGFRSTRTCPGEPRCSGRDDGRPHLEPDPAEAQVVADVFAWALEGHAMATIADRLNEAGAAPRSARWKFKDDRTVTGWKYNAVRALLTSPTVAGLRAHTDADGVLHTTPARWEALVDVDTWRRVQRLLGQPATVTGSNGETYRVRTMPKAQPRRYLLSGGRRRGVAGQPGDVYGVLRCGKCGMPLVAQTQGRRGGVRVPAYQCHPKVGAEACGGVSISPADAVETFVVTAIQRRLAASSKLRSLLSATQDADAARWRAERDAAKARMLDAGARYGARAIDADTFDAMHGAAKADYDAAQAHLAAMTSDVELPSADDVIERWESLTLAQQRGVVERLIERIDIAPGHKGHPGFNEARIGVPVWRA